MNNALVFQYKATIKNTIKTFIKNPIKLIGAVLIIGYFIFLPFIFKPIAYDFNVNTPEYYIVFMAFLSLYVSMPSTLSYFKRKGVVFRKQDINFTFATPITPKQALLFAIIKTAILSFFMQIVFIICSIFVFSVPVGKALAVGVGDLVFSSLASYSLAIIMYASEDLSLKTKEWIKRAVYVALITVTLFIAFIIIQNGVSIDSIQKLVSHPVILLVPIFGWQLGWINLIILGPTIATVTSSILYILSAIGLAWYAIKMPCSGDYYEDALAFSEKQSLIESKQKSGNLSFFEALGVKKKIHEGKGILSGTGARVIFSRQIMERQRSSLLFFSFGDFVYLIVGIGIGIAHFFFDLEIPSEMFFGIFCGITMYFIAFFSPQPTWKDEFSQPTLFVIPDSIGRKLLYATLLDHGVSLARAIMLTLPSGLLIGAPIGDIVMTIIAQVMIRAMIIYLSVITREWFGAKLGPTVSQIIHMVVIVVALIVPSIGVTMTFTGSVLNGFIVILAYSTLLSIVFIKVSEKILTNIESLH